MQVIQVHALAADSVARVGLAVFNNRGGLADSPALAEEEPALADVAGSVEVVGKALLDHVLDA